MAEKLPEIEPEEIQELKKNAEKKKQNQKKAHKKLFFGGATLSMQVRLPLKATKCSKSSHLTLRKINLLASYFKQSQVLFGKLT